MKVLSLSVLPFGWNNNTNTGMPSVKLALDGYVAHGHHVRYITIDKSKNQKDTKNALLSVQYIKVNFSPISIPILYSITQSLYALYIWMRLYTAGNREIKKEKPDVIIGNTFYGAIPAYCLSKRYGIPYLFREYGTMELTNVVLGKNVFHKISKWNEIKAYKLHADGYIFTDDGSNTIAAAKHLGVDMGKVHFLKNGYFDLGNLDTTVLNPNTFNIVTAARLSAFKHIDDIIKAFSLIKQNDRMRLYIIGDGEQKEYLKSLVTKYCLNGNIIMTGALLRDTVLSYFISADLVLALGSINPMLEAMTCSKPVITLELGSTSSFVTDKDNVAIIRDTDPKTIATAINELYSNKNYREKLGINAGRHIRGTFKTWEERINQEIEIVEMLGSNL